MFARRRSAYNCRATKARMQMNEEKFNTSIRQFLKKVGVTSQREIEKAVRAALAGGRLKGDAKLPAKVTLALDQVDLSLTIDGVIELE